MSKQVQTEDEEQKVKDNAELDWFDFETRMRLIIRDMVNPILLRQTQFDTILDEFNIKLIKYNTRIEDLEQTVQKSNIATSRWEELYNTFNQLEADLTIRDNNSHLKITNLTTDLELYRRKFDDIYSRLNEVDEGINRQSERIQENFLNISVNKHSILEQFNSYSIQFKKTIETIQDDVKEVTNDSSEAHQLAQENRALLIKSENQIEYLNKVFKDMQQNLQEINLQKLDKETYEKNIREVSNRFTLVEFAQKTLTNHLTNTDDQIDKYLPVKIQYQISMTLHEILDWRIRKKLSDFEDQQQRDSVEGGSLLNNGASTADQEFNYKFKPEIDQSNDELVEKEEAFVKNSVKEMVMRVKKKRIEFLKDFKDLKLSNDNFFRAKLLESKIADEIQEKLRKKAEEDQSETATEPPTPKVDVVNHLKENINKLGKPSSKRVNIEEELTPIKEHLDNQLKLFNGKVDVIDSQVYGQSKEFNNMIETMRTQFYNTTDDINIRTDANTQEISNIKYLIDMISEQFNKINQLVRIQMEWFKIQHALDTADENDRDSYGLQGIKEGLKGELLSKNRKDKLKPLHSNNFIDSYSTNAFDSKEIVKELVRDKEKYGGKDIIQSNDSGTLDNKFQSFNRQLHIRPDKSSKRSMAMNNSVNQVKYSNKIDKFNYNVNDDPKIINELNIELKNECISCLGNKGTINQIFKLACLNQTSSRVKYLDKSQERRELLKIREDFQNQMKKIKLKL